MRNKAYFNVHQDLYASDEPPFYDCSKIDEVRQIEAHFSAIHAEMTCVLEDANLCSKAFNKRAYAKEENWSQIELKLYGLHYPDKINLFPQTFALINQIEGVSSIYFSFLEKQSAIQPHNGDTDAFYRIHLGIQIPDGLPSCGLEVAGQKTGWEVGKCIDFNDISFHKSWNLSNEQRVVLIVDLLRPEFSNEYKKINAGVIATLIHSRLYKRLGLLFELFPRFINRLFHPIIYVLVRVYFSAKVK
jgi:aspartyl/asparaginyl beta-hydroxylase (cupin superfamily)